MKVVITDGAVESLWPIYQHHMNYSEEFAVAFQNDIDRFIFDNLIENPELGHIYDQARGLRRLIFQKRYNIYYVIRDEMVVVLFIFDGRMDINQNID